MADPVTLANAVGWGISILGWAISPVISKFVNKGLDYLEDVTTSSVTNLENLEKNFGLLKLMLENAQAVPPGDKKTKLLEGWAKELKSAFYDAEDIMDAIDYHRLKTEVLLHHQSVNTGKQKATPKKDSDVPNASKKELRKTLKRIEDLIDQGQKLLPLTTSGDKSSGKQTMRLLSKSSQTTSEPPKVFGRDEDTKKIISMLHDTQADHSVIGIHGIAGSGKTTLAQYVCDCEKKSEGRNFELFMWIHVTKNFSVHTIFHEMLEIASGEKMGSISNLDMLQSELKKRLKGKRLLLVLDDVWVPDPEIVDGQNHLEKLVSPFKEADKGSRILVTSRTADAAKLVGAQNLMPISDMNEEEFFKMFMHYALDNSKVSDQDKGTFETIGRQISLLLRKSPLAARTVAGQLRLRTSRAEDISFWKDTRKRKGDVLNDTMGALWWSYHQFDEHVRQCFAYCSMFPRRYHLDRDELVKMWMAQGFVENPSKNSDMEVAARECFEILLSTSFIQLKGDFEGTEYYTVHDLLHDLAESVAGSDCFRIEKDMVAVDQIPQDVRHLFIDSNNLGEFMDQIVKLDTLRTIVVSSSGTGITPEDFKRMLKNLKKLRVVSVWLETFETKTVIPECIGKLKHLRYLGLEGFACGNTMDLPDGFYQLYHLQEISLSSDWRILRLGRFDKEHIANLSNLRHFGGLEASIPHIGRMRWLRTLKNGFTVKKEKGYEITQLENMDHIRGKLHIRGLGNIQSKEEAHRAQLSNKLDVSDLIFDWNSDVNEETGSSSTKKQKTAAGHHQPIIASPEEILEALHPPALLVGLTIEHYGGSTFPSWLSGEDGKLKHLKRLRFFECHGSGSQFKFSIPLLELHQLKIFRCSWNALPDNIEQLASLEKLSIYSCPNIQSPPGLPSSLKKLEIGNCPNILALPELPPSLEELQIKDDCPNIKSLPGLPSSLKILGIIWRCPNIITIPEWPPSLEELHIVASPNIRSPPGLPSSLKILQIHGCPDISTLPELPPSLEEPEIKDCPNIMSLPELPPSLEELEILDCPNIMSLPGLPSSLKKLKIDGCPDISTLPELPPSLKELECEKYLVDSYPDKQAIGRIERIYYWRLLLPLPTKSNMHVK